jgi:hypothetical protein
MKTQALSWWTEEIKFCRWRNEAPCWLSSNPRIHVTATAELKQTTPVSIPTNSDGCASVCRDNILSAFSRDLGQSFKPKGAICPTVSCIRTPLIFKRCFVARLVPCIIHRQRANEWWTIKIKKEVVGQFCLYPHISLCGVMRNVKSG